MEFPRALSAKFKEDFAYPTIKDRVPVILTKIVDHVYRLKSTATGIYGEDAVEDLKKICGDLSQLKNEMQTDKPLRDICDGEHDNTGWNTYRQQVAERDGGPPSWFTSSWLYTECYFYRRVQESINSTRCMKEFDPFREQKQNAYQASIQAISGLGSYLNDTLEDFSSARNTDNVNTDKQLQEIFLYFLELCLWGNKCDLSISGGTQNAQTSDPIHQLQHYQPYILSDHSHRVWCHLQAAVDTRQVDIVLDNAGYELFTDLVLAEVLLATGLATAVHFHAKDIPWFVSDVTPEDFTWTLDELSHSQTPCLTELAGKWKGRLEDGSWELSAHPFWTTPHDYGNMTSLAPDLHSDLIESSLLIFKGDLNYRKLVGDLKWAPTTPFITALRGFCPAPLCTLRTLKCDVTVGLETGVAETTQDKDKDWMINGNWAVIQFSH